MRLKSQFKLGIEKSGVENLTLLGCNPAMVRSFQPQSFSPKPFETCFIIYAAPETEPEAASERKPEAAPEEPLKRAQRS